MDVASDPTRSVTDHPRVLPILRRLVPDPCREWIDSPDNNVFDWGQFRYCRQRREDGLIVFVGFWGLRGVPDCFAGDKVTWSPVWPSHECEANIGRHFELWCADLLRKGETLPSIDGRIPAMGIDSWRGCSGGGGSRPYHILVDRERVLTSLAERDAEPDGLRDVRCGISRGKVALLFPRLDETDSRRRYGFQFLIQSRDAADALSRRWTGMEPDAAGVLAEDMQALCAFLEDPEIAALAWSRTKE